ncbi:MAG: SOS response-associated peptidase [Phycisphaeraceae bacterium]|nr:SOS response-associated peptidase [Phycisphaeraceae bacterium]MCB9847497.1 SOS response-associated peptidase [Phycisphaeraceae bacterium]
MCGRFTILYQWRDVYMLLEKMGLPLPGTPWGEVGPERHYNVAPTRDIPALRAGEHGIEPAMLRWWLIPHWAKSDEMKYATFNARSEDAATKPAFRTPMRRRRCVIPVSGFYEWKKLDAKSKQPHYITRADGEPIFFAGLWDRWEDPESDRVIESCAICTTKPNAEMEAVHNRMPCILEPEDVWAWCDPGMTDADRAAAMLRTPPDGLLVMHEVSGRVGNAKKNNDAALIEAV